MKISLSEKIAFAAFIMALLINLFLSQIPGKNILFILISTLLMLVYMFFGFGINNGLGFRKMFIKKSYKNILGSEILIAIILGLAFSISLCSILFKVMLWPGAIILGLSSAVFLIFGLIIVLVINTDKRNSYVIRMIPFIIFSTISYKISNNDMLEFKYRHLPDQCIEFHKKRKSFSGPPREYKKLEEEYKDCLYYKVKRR